MKGFRQLGVLVLLLVSCLAPATACMVPDGQMNAQERACCRMMNHKCGQMKMPGSGNCCDETPPSVHDDALRAKTVTFHPPLLAVVWLTASELLPSPSGIAAWVDSPEYSLPHSPPSTVFILRI
jgi:hypothetical protein